MQMSMCMHKLNSYYSAKLVNYPLRCCHVMYKLLYPSIRVRTLPPVSVRVRVRVSVLRCNAIAHTVLHVSHNIK